MIPVGFGIIGSGTMASFHARAIGDAPGARLVAIAGGSRARDLASEYGVQAATDVASLLRRNDIQAVVIATPHSTHRALVEEAAAAGKHILLEKPMALTVADCDAMIVACRQSGVAMSLAKTTRWLQATQIARQIVLGGEIGEIRMIHVHRLINDVGYPTSGWTIAPGEGDAFLDWGSHGCDIVRWFARSEPAVVFGRFQSFGPPVKPDLSGMITIGFANGVMSQFWASYEMPNPWRNERAHYEFVGSRGIVDLHAYGQLDILDDAGRRTVFRAPGFNGADTGNDMSVPYWRTAFAAQVSDLVNAIRTDTSPAITGVDGRMAVVMAQAARESSLSGQAVAL
jgi:predicted dehydrogenase